MYIIIYIGTTTTGSLSAAGFTCTPVPCPAIYTVAIAGGCVCDYALYGNVTWYVKQILRPI